MAARQQNNELVADLLARAGDPDIRQAAARDLHKLTRTIIGLAVIADDIMLEQFSAAVPFDGDDGLVVPLTPGSGAIRPIGWPIVGIGCEILT